MTLIRALLAAVLVAAPLPFAAVSSRDQALAALILGLLAFAAALLCRDEQMDRGTRSLLIAGTLLASVPAVQLVPLPKAAVRLLAPATAAFYDTFSLTPRSWIPLSQSPGETRAALIWLLVCLACALTVTLCCRWRHARMLLTILMVGAVFQAIYGSFELLSGRHRIFSYIKIHNLDSATGTFINRNHYACHLAMALSLSLGLLAARRDEQEPGPAHGWRERLAALADERRLQIFWLAGGMVLLTAGLSFSYSRGGVLAALAGLLTACWALGRPPGRRASHRLGWLALALFLGLLPLAVHGLGRFSRTSETLPQELAAGSFRPALWTASLDMAAASPLTGHGLGAYQQTFPRFRPASVQKRVSHAHQDYLQWAAETGVLGSAAALAAAVLVFLAARRLGRLPQGRGQRSSRSLRAGVWGALAAFLFHGLFDFNAHIPANALTVSALVGVLLIPPAGAPADLSSRSRHRTRRGVLAVGALAALWGLAYLWHDHPAMQRLAPLRADGGWQRAVVRDGLEPTAERVQRAIAISSQPEVLETAAGLLNALAASSGLPERSRQLHHRAYDLAAEAVRIEPGRARAHYQAVLALAATGEAPERARWHARSASLLDPHNAVFRARLGLLTLSSGPRREGLGHLQAALTLDPELAEEALISLHYVQADAPPCRDAIPDTVAGLLALARHVRTSHPGEDPGPLLRLALDRAMEHAGSDMEPGGSVLMAYRAYRDHLLQHAPRQELAEFSRRMLRRWGQAGPGFRARLLADEARALRGEEMLWEALQKALAASALAPGDPGHSALAARLLDALRLPEAAVSEWRHTLTLTRRRGLPFQAEADTLLSLARSLKEAGQRVAAADQVRLVLLARPDDQEAGKFLEELVQP